MIAAIACLAGVVLPVANAQAEAETWYVKAANYGREDLTGRDEEHAWGTLQQAHDAASAGDTIYVYPGTYNQGSKKGNSLASRLVVSKQLHFVATGSAAETEIVGYRPSSGNGYNIDGSIRCVSVTSGGAGTTFTHFTFRDGGSGNGTKQPWSYNGEAVTGGGGICCYGLGNTAWERAYLIECVISNCGATWGSAMYGGTAIRCLIKNNRGSGWGGVVCSAALWNSVVIGTKNDNSVMRSAVGTSCRVVNSLIAGTSSLGAGDVDASHRSVYYNTLFTACGSTSMYSGNFTNCVATSRGVYSPATGDFRPVAGLEADGAGLTEFITNTIALPEGLEMKDFNGNPIDLTKETCDAGPVQGAVAVDSGAVVVPVGTSIDGTTAPLYKATYARAKGKWPSELVVRPVSESFLRYKATGDLCGGPTYRYLQRDGVLRVIPSPTTSHTLTLTAQKYTVELWCDPGADAAVATGEESAPFATIQDAVVAATNALAQASGAAVIRLKPGDYRSGHAVARDHRNRMYLPAGYTIFVASTDGAAATTVYGEADQNPPEAYYAGCGPDAMRCACLLGDNAVQGVTFADGHSSCTGETADKTADRVGGIYSDGEGQQLLDCVVTNCTAVRGGAAYWGVFERCRFYDCVSFGGVLRYCTLAGSYVDESCHEGEGRAGLESNSALGTESVMVLCTAPNVSYYANGAAYSTTFGDQKVYKRTQYGSVFRTATEVAAGAAHYAVRDPCFVNLDGGDCRLATGTPAAEASSAAIGERGTSAWNEWATAIAGFWQGDVDGNPIKVVGGAVLPGCYHETVDGGVYVASPKGGVAVPGGAVMALNFIEDGEELEVRPANGERPCPGVLVNGVTNMFDDGVSFTTADLAAAGGGICVEPFYTKDWYVDPDGDDGACGFTPKTAKKTLAAAIAMTASGDTVHAAEGRYTEGVGSAKPGATHPDSRVYIPGGRTLVADGAADKTFIVGNIGTEFANTIGCGSNSVRCVYMAKDSKLKGFTLTDGTAYPANGTSDYGQIYNCGGVYGSGRDTCVVQDCIITNCAAYNAAAAREVSFVGCRIAGNKASAGITSECYHFGCIVDGNYAGSSSVYKHTRVVDTTIGPHAYKLDGKAGTGLGMGSSKSAVIANSMILAPYSVANVSITVSNCVLLAGNSSMFASTQNCVVATLAQAALDDDLRPIAGRSVACDIADAETRASAPDAVYPIMMQMRERANNGCRLDAGALEADWRGVYAKDMGGRRFSVSHADNAVEESATGTVIVPEGATLVGAWRNSGMANARFVLRFVVSEGGSLDVTAGGATTTFAEGEHEYTFVGDAESVDVAFTSTSGTAEILKCGRIVGAALLIR